MPYRIVIADPNRELRGRIRFLLEQAGWEVIGEALDGQEAVDLAQKLSPDLVTLDIGMPVKNGLEAATEILKTVPRAKVLILTIHEAEEIRNQALRAGVHGYALKTSGPELIEQVRKILTS